MTWISIGSSDPYGFLEDFLGRGHGVQVIGLLRRPASAHDAALRRSSDVASISLILLCHLFAFMGELGLFLLMWRFLIVILVRSSSLVSLRYHSFRWRRLMCRRLSGQPGKLPEAPDKGTMVTREGFPTTQLPKTLESAVPACEHLGTAALIRVPCPGVRLTRVGSLATQETAATLSLQRCPLWETGNSWAQNEYVSNDGPRLLHSEELNNEKLAGTTRRLRIGRFTFQASGNHINPKRVGPVKTRLLRCLCCGTRRSLES